MVAQMKKFKKEQKGRNVVQHRQKCIENRKQINPPNGHRLRWMIPYDVCTGKSNENWKPKEKCSGDFIQHDFIELVFLGSECVQQSEASKDPAKESPEFGKAKTQKSC
jgi:hypothetical protein